MIRCDNLYTHVYGDNPRAIYCYNSATTSKPTGTLSSFIMCLKIVPSLASYKSVKLCKSGTLLYLHV